MAWPVVTEACVGPFESVTWLAALQVVTSRCGGDPARLAALGLEEFTALVRAAVPAWGGTKGWGKIIGRVFAATGDTEGVVTWFRRGLLRRSPMSWVTWPAPARPGLPRQRSTELVRSSGRPGRAAQGLKRGWSPRAVRARSPLIGGGRSRAPAAVRADG